MEPSGSRFDRIVRRMQWAFAVAVILFVVGIVTWIIHLLRNAWWLGDVPSASIGISLVAIPVFVVLLSVVLYVFIGLLSSPRKP